ncbi:MAG TPA: cupin domain-containing protein [Beijerinckiaceae bacterium]
MTQAAEHKTRAPLASGAREMMEALNVEAAPLNIWLRTQANAPAQRPWMKETGLEAAGALAAGRVAAAQMKAKPHLWKWREISPYLEKIAGIAASADVPPIEFADRQQFLLTNPGLGGRLQIAAALRCAVSIYNPGDVAPAHLHSPNASRTILSENGGYTNVEGERCPAARGDVILTPNGTWHDHGNDGDKPVTWIDTLDWPVLEFLDLIWLDEDMPGAEGNHRMQKATVPEGYSQALYSRGGLVPTFVPHARGVSRDTSPYIHFRGADIRAALQALRREDGDAYEGVPLAMVNPVTGGPLFPTIGYGAQMIRAGEETRLKRETATTVYVAMQGRGQTEVAGQVFDWEENDIFVVPNFLWRRHRAAAGADAILYTMTDAPLVERIGQYRAQGRTAAGEVVQLV